MQNAVKIETYWEIKSKLDICNNWVETWVMYKFTCVLLFTAKEFHEVCSVRYSWFALFVVSGREFTYVKEGRKQKLPRTKESLIFKVNGPWTMDYFTRKVFLWWYPSGKEFSFLKENVLRIYFLQFSGLFARCLSKLSYDFWSENSGEFFQKILYRNSKGWWHKICWEMQVDCIYKSILYLYVCVCAKKITHY